MSTPEIEDLETFRARARAFIRSTLAPIDPSQSIGPLRNERTDEEELAAVARDREVQRMLFDAGLAGICFPKAYGGQGLTPEHQRAFNHELAGFEYPSRLQAPTLSPCAAVLLDFGTEEQKLAHIPAILKGEEIWMQFLSEPSGGSDVAGALTSAVRDGEEWVLNGSKIWTTGAWWSDWGLCLARTNWDVPKHRGLTVFILPIRQPGLDVHRIEMLNGSKEFCQEFLTDVRVPDSDRVGDVDDGWTVGTRWMFHERMLTNSPLVTVPAGMTHGGRQHAHDRDGQGRGPPGRPATCATWSARPTCSRSSTASSGGASARGSPRAPCPTSRRPSAACSMASPRPGCGVSPSRSPGQPVPPGPGRRRTGLRRVGLPHASGVLHRGRHHRDGPQRDQRAGPRHAPGALLDRDVAFRDVPRSASSRP